MWFSILTDASKSGKKFATFYLIKQHQKYLNDINDIPTLFLEKFRFISVTIFLCIPIHVIVSATTSPVIKHKIWFCYVLIFGRIIKLNRDINCKANICPTYSIFYRICLYYHRLYQIYWYQLSRLELHQASELL